LYAALRPVIGQQPSVAIFTTSKGERQVECGGHKHCAVNELAHVQTAANWYVTIVHITSPATKFFAQGHQGY
jgi:hypothetical protein